MPYELEETGELTRTATVTVPQEDFEKRINKALRKLSKNVNLKGFRKGKVPLPVMRQRYGAAVTRDVVEEIVNDNINELLDDVDNVLYLGTPQVTQVPTGEEAELIFSVDLELRPEIDPIGFLGMDVEKPKVEIGGDDIDEYLESLRQEHADKQPVVTREVIASGDIVTVDFKALSDHPELEQMKGEDVEIEIGSGQALPGIDEALEGADLDATVESEIELGEDFPVEELRGTDVPIQLDVKKVERRVLPEIDDDFALKTGEGETLLELRGNIRKKLEEAREEEARRHATESMIDSLLEKHDFELPPQFLDQQLERTAKQRLQMLSGQGLDLDELGIDIGAFKEQMAEDVTRQIKTEFLLVEIARKEKIEVNEEDLLNFFEGQAERMGVPVQQYMAFVGQNQDAMRQANATVLLEKTKSHLLDEATITDVEWPEEEEPEEEPAEEEEAADGSDEEPTEEDSAADDETSDESEESEESDEDKS